MQFLFATHILFAGSNGTIIWGKPSTTGKFDSSCNCYRTVDWGWNSFISHSQLKRRSFLKNDDLIIFAEFNGNDHFLDSLCKCKLLILSIPFYSFTLLSPPVPEPSSLLMGINFEKHFCVLVSSG